MNAQVFIREESRQESGPQSGYAVAGNAREALQKEPAAELAVVIPTFCERGNVIEVIRRLRNVLAGISWEAVFVERFARWNRKNPEGDRPQRPPRALRAQDRQARAVWRVYRGHARQLGAGHSGDGRGPATR